MKVKIYILFLFLFLCQMGVSQSYDPAYIAAFKTKLNFRLQANQTAFRYSLSPRASDIFSPQELKKGKTNYGSYIPFSTGFAINILFIGFSYEFKFSNEYFNTANKSITNLSSYKLAILGKKIVLDGYYNKFSNIYFNNNERLFSSLIINNADIIAKQWGINFKYVANSNRFSYKAAFAQTQFQKKSACSLIYWFGYQQNKVEKPGGLILDSAAAKYYEKLQALDKVTQRSLFIMLGLGSNLVYKKWYFSSGIYAGTGPQFNDIHALNWNIKAAALPFLAKARLGAGFNGKTIYTGVYAHADYSLSAFDNLKTNYLGYQLGIFAGVRIIRETKTKEEIKAEKLKKEEAIKAEKLFQKAEKKRLKEERKKKK
jgi:hypothetical protein